MNHLQQVNLIAKKHLISWLSAQFWLHVRKIPDSFRTYTYQKVKYQRVHCSRVGDKFDNNFE